MPSVTVEKQAKGVAVLTLAKEPVNTMGFDLWRDLSAAYDACAADPEVRGIVFRSGLKRPVFTAGLDINELYSPNTSKERFFEYWGLLTGVLVKIYMSPKFTVAAINGACPAGGCALAMCCDARLITKDGTMGLNEVALGLMPPPYWAKLYRDRVGQAAAERQLGLGDLVKGEALKEHCLVDEFVKDPGELLPEALKEAGRWLQFPDPGRVATKKVLREAFAAEWSANAMREAAELWALQETPESVAALGKVLERLSGGKAKSKL